MRSKYELKISVVTLKNICIFLTSFLMFFKLFDYSLLYHNLDFISYETVMFLNSIVIILFSGASIQKKATLFYLLLIILLIATFARGEAEYFAQNCMLIFSLFIIFNLKKSSCYAVILSAAVAIIPYFLRWLLAMVRLGNYLGNRGPLHFAAVGLLGLIFLYQKKFKPLWQYLLMIVLIFITFIGQSRTSLVACCVSVGLMVFLQFQGKFTLKKMITLAFFGVLGVGVLFYLQDRIIELFFNKWSGQTTIFTGRSMMWIDVLTDIRWWGFERDYIPLKYGLDNIHNGYLQAYTSFGVIAGILYILLTITTLLKGLRTRKNYDIQGLMIVFLPFIALSFFESTFIMDTGYPFLGVCTTIILGQIYRISEETRVSKIDTHIY